MPNRKVLGWLGAVWVALVLVNYAAVAPLKRGAEPRFDRIRLELIAGRSVDPAVIVRTIGSVAVAGLAVVGMFGAGLPVLRFALGKTRRGVGRMPFVLAGGFAGIGMILLGLGCVGIFRTPIAWAVIVMGAMSGLRSVAALRRRARGRGRRSRSSWQWPVVAVGAALAALSSSALGPETEIDSLTYHLARARHLLLEGRFTVQPSLMFSFPPVWESWLALLLGTGGEQAARFLNPIVVGASALMLHAVVERVRPGCGWLAAAVYSCSFLTLAAGSASKNDPAAAWLCLAAFAAVARSAGRTGDGWAVVAGGFAGAAILVKLTTAPVVLIAALLLGRAGRRRVLLGVFTAMLICLPWEAHQWLQRDNPVHPLLGGYSAFPPPPGAVENLRDDLARYVAGSYDSVPDTLRAIWSVATAEGMTPLAVLAVPVAVAGGAWARIALALVALWAVGPPQPRYLLPALPLLAAAVAAWALSDRLKVRWRLTAVAALVAVELMRGWTDPAADRVARVQVATGVMSRAEYLRVRLTTWGDVALRINRELPADSRILPVGERRGYPLERRFIPVSFDDPAPWLRLSAASRGPDRLAVRVRQLGVTHVLYNPLTADFLSAGFARVRPSDRALAVWAAYWRTHTRRVSWPARWDLREGEYALFELGPARGGGSPALLPGIEGWTAAVSALGAAGDRPAALRRLAELERLAGGYPVLGLWRVMISGAAMPAAEALARLQQCERDGLAVAHLYAGLARAARRAGRGELADRYERRFRELVPETWLRQP